MEAINVALKQPLRFEYSLNRANSSVVQVKTSSELGFPCRRRRPIRLQTSYFNDQAHVEYYKSSSTARKMRVLCGQIDELEKDKADYKTKKNLLKGISKDLLTLSRLESGIKDDRIQKAAELLMEQLRNLKDNEKKIEDKKQSENSSSESSDDEAKQKQQEDDDSANLENSTISVKTKKSKKMKKSANCESSSSSSESSDSDCDKVKLVDINSLKAETPLFQSSASIQPIVSERKPVSLQEDNSLKKIEVCMGGKCKRSGAEALIEEFQRAVGIDGTVEGCKCMGKCKEGPNVKVDAKSLCLGVGMEDVGVIVANLLGRDEDEAGFGFAAAS